MDETDREPEQQLDKLQDQSDSLGEEIAEAREDWEDKKLDPAVPGADGDPQAADSDDAANAYPAKGSADSLDEDLPAG
jgi:hypothetical protein